MRLRESSISHRVGLQTLSNAKVVMTRAGSVLTDMYISPEAMADVRSWDNAAVDEQTRRDILLLAALLEITTLCFMLWKSLATVESTINISAIACPTNSLTGTM